MSDFPRQRIRKYPPFDLSGVKDDHPYFSHLLVQSIAQLDHLPDFTDDDKIAIFSDFGGEHKEARFSTYSFLIMAYGKVGPFQEKIKELRKKHGILDPYTEFKFKRLTYGPRARALPEFLDIVDTFIHGAIVTVAVDKRVDTVFGDSRKSAHTRLTEKLEILDLGQWKGDAAEKVLRVCHSIAVFVSLLTREGQRLLWYCDNDAINEQGKKRDFEDTQGIFTRVLGMYSRHKFDLIGFGKSFDDKSHLDDLLSIPDFAAGLVQDLLQGHESGLDKVPVGDEKAALMKWMATEAKFLSKITIQIGPLANGQIGSGMPTFTLANKQNVESLPPA